MLALTRLGPVGRSNWSKNSARALTASTRALNTWRTSLLEGGRRLGRALTGGSADEAFTVGELDVNGLELAAESETGVLGRSTHGFSGGVCGVVYWESAARDRSHRLGTHTPTKTLQAAMIRFALYMKSTVTRVDSR